jgi:putative addiction module killer protein
MNYTIKELIQENGINTYADWFASLDAIAAAKVRTALARMEQGNLSNAEWFRGIAEYKIDFGPGYRIYFAQEGKTVFILLGGSTKKDQQRRIDQAVSLWESYKKQHKGNS